MNRSPLVLNLFIKMQNNGTSHYIIRNTDRALSTLARPCNLQDPEDVKNFIARHNVSHGYKMILCSAYKR